MEKVKYNRHEYRNEYLKSDEWKLLRSTVINAGCLCQCCNSVATDAHHMVYRNIVDITIKDLIPVCRSCHDYIHQAIDDKWISQDPKQFDDIKYKTLNILDDNEYKEFREWLSSKHELSEFEINQITRLQPFVIKKISGLIKRNIWYDSLPTTKFTGRQIVKIREIVKLALQRRRKRFDKPITKLVVVNSTKSRDLSLKDMPGFKSKRGLDIN